MSKELSYKEALTRINQIVNRIENEDPDIDELSQLVKEATALIAQCKEKLENTETEIQSSLEKLN
ncbi:exodeoxyribonuclease VII small subunit [Roseivirga sp.]|uniref:exodeoxyribonuclease VII small subunit n=1 Tax=Roseivirga sp. TaxID=1964215 RepID=UPI003B523B60